MLVIFSSYIKLERVGNLFGYLWRHEEAAKGLHAPPHHPSRRECTMSTQMPWYVCVTQLNSFKSFKCHFFSEWSSEWSTFSDCSETCGPEATKTRKKECVFNGDVVSPTMCNGDQPSQTVECGLDQCQGKDMHMPNQAVISKLSHWYQVYTNNKAAAAPVFT